MQAAQRWRLAVTRSPPGVLLLAAALVVHLALALWRNARLRTWRLPSAANWQLGSGALIAVLIDAAFFEAGVGPRQAGGVMTYPAVLQSDLAGKAVAQTACCSSSGRTVPRASTG